MSLKARKKARFNPLKYHIKKGDTVYIITGKEKGKTGKVLRILKKDNSALIEKLNIVKRHAKPSQKSPTGGIMEKESAIHLSNLMLNDQTSGGPVRTGRRVLDSGEKVRYSKKTGEEIAN